MDPNTLMQNEIEIIINYIEQAETQAEELARLLKTDLETIQSGDLYKNLQSGKNAENEISALKYASESVQTSIQNLKTSVEAYKYVDWSE